MLRRWLLTSSVPFRILHTATGRRVAFTSIMRRRAYQYLGNEAVNNGVRFGGHRNNLRTRRTPEIVTRLAPPPDALYAVGERLCLVEQDAALRGQCRTLYAPDNATCHPNLLITVAPHKIEPAPRRRSWSARSSRRPLA